MAKAKKQPKRQSPNIEEDEVVQIEDEKIEDVAPSDDDIAAAIDDSSQSDQVAVSDTDEGFEIGTIVADTPEANEEDDGIDLTKAKELDPAYALDENYDYAQDDEGDDFLGYSDDDEDVDDYDEVY